MNLQRLYLLVLVCVTMMSLQSCKKDNSVLMLESEPTCPECEEESMVCIDLQCECPEGTIVNWLEAWWPGAEIAKPRKFCIEPSPYTFIAEFEPVGCVDTFTITFPWEPLTELAPGDNGNGPGMATFLTMEGPGKGEEVMYHLYYVAPDSLELYFFRFPPNYGGEQMMYNSCTEYDENGERIGLVNRGFMGIFVHPDTIRGELFYFNGNGTLEYLEGSRTPVDLIRTVPYEE